MSVSAGSAEDRPNFIFFITDDISAEDLGPYGSSAVKTPNLDRLAAEGMVFDQAYLTASSCSVSRTSMITSRYPHNTGSPELHLPLPKGQPVFPAMLKRAGYYTVLSGKSPINRITWTPREDGSVRQHWEPLRTVARAGRRLSTGSIGCGRNKDDAECGSTTGRRRSPGSPSPTRSVN